MNRSDASILVWPAWQRLLPARRRATSSTTRSARGWCSRCCLRRGLAAASGALYVTDRYWGVAWVIGVHTVCGWSLAVLAPLHIAGAIVTGHRERENLIAAMLHGRKRRPPG